MYHGRTPVAQRKQKAKQRSEFLFREARTRFSMKKLQWRDI
jgi:hypothetical protein